MRTVFSRIQPRKRPWTPPTAITSGSATPQPLGEILEELLAQYEIKFPGVHITVVETAATAA
jgi:hypothetical protein